MDNKDSGSNLALWIPGSALILSLVVSTFALTRSPFLEPRPLGGEFQARMPIEARLWQDPFDALERYRNKLKGTEAAEAICPDYFPPPTPSPASMATDLTLSLLAANGTLALRAVQAEKAADEAPVRALDKPADAMLAIVEGGPYADEVELRRRIRYAILAGFKNTHWVPADEQHILCRTFHSFVPASATPMELPYETLVANPLNFSQRLDGQGAEGAKASIQLFWVKEEFVQDQPLERLDALRKDIARLLGRAPDDFLLKVIGPSSSGILRLMYRDEMQGHASPLVEIYSPTATAEKALLMCSLGVPTGDPAEQLCRQSEGRARAAQTPATQTKRPVEPMKLIRTVSDDGRLASLLLDELKLRRVDPVRGVVCGRGMYAQVGVTCDGPGAWPPPGRVVLIAEWDSIYGRALTESFKARIADRARLKDRDRAMVNDWVLEFSYLRGVDGRLPDQQAKSEDKAARPDSRQNSFEMGTLERADGDSQLDYLRRLADHIAALDESDRRAGGGGVSAIGVLGTDVYDKLLVLQAMKARMPGKLYFSTELDARMLQRGQAETTRNLVLASPYGLTLTRTLQQDVPPFRDSLQSAVFTAVLAAQSPKSFDFKQAKFDPDGDSLLSPGIYEIGMSGFIPLASRTGDARGDFCDGPRTRRSWAAGDKRPRVTDDIMALSCLQDPPPPIYPDFTQTLREKLGGMLSLWWGGWLILLMAALLLFFGWWWADERQSRGPTTGDLPAWVRHLPLAFYLSAGVFAWICALQWKVQLIWVTCLLIVLGIFVAQLNRRHREKNLGRAELRLSGSLFDSSAYYLVLPALVFVLALLWGYQSREMLTEDGLGEPMFLFEGISAWPTIALRLLATLISISALAWGWRCLRLNRLDIEREFGLLPSRATLWRRFPRWRRGRSWAREMGAYLSLILVPLSNGDLRRALRPEPAGGYAGSDGRRYINVQAFWREHCLGGVFGARLLRALLATWIFAVFTGVLFALWPMEASPVRGELLWGKAPWMLPILAFQLLVFWVVDANFLLIRFIRQLIRHHAIWPRALERQHRAIFGMDRHACIDDWADVLLIARRTAAVSRLIYAPTIVLLILIASRSSVFDNWPTPPGLIISFVATGVLLFVSALSLRRAAEKARATALQHIDAQLLMSSKEDLGYTKFQMIRERIANLNTGAFSRYSEEPLVRALLVSLTGIGGSIIVDVLNYAKF